MGAGALMAFDMFGSYLKNTAAKKGIKAKSKTLEASATAYKLEGLQQMLTAVLDIGQLRKKGVRDLSEIEASFAESGIDLDQSTIESLLDAQTEIELAAQIRKLEGQYERGQSFAMSKSEKRQALDAKDASRFSLTDFF